jgi:type IV secretory pathway VirB3-like protein
MFPIGVTCVIKHPTIKKQKNNNLIIYMLKLPLHLIYYIISYNDPIDIRIVSTNYYTYTPRLLNYDLEINICY